MYIEKLKIKGYKIFNEFEMSFNKKYSVIIGDNESGKSTILEALDIVLNQTLFNYESSNFEQYFNHGNKKRFQETPIFDNLPEIEIEVFLSGTKKIKDSYFNGYHSSERQKSISGIKFLYKFNEEFKGQFSEFGFKKETDNVFIPTDYYKATWNTFSGKSYHRRKTPLKTLIIDNSIRVNNLFNSYSKQVYNNKLGIEDRNRLSHSLKDSLDGFIKDNEKLLKVGKYSFGIDEKKSYIEQLIDLQATGISLQNMGKGKESLIKTEIALENTSELILIEEPENHLSHINTRKLIEKINGENVDAQVIITTHSPLVVSRMNLTNTIWINDCKAKSLKDIPTKIAAYFERTDNLDILNFILSNKAVLVEGNSEYILLPFLVNNVLENQTLDSEGVEVFSAAGLTYKNYIEVSKEIKNKLLIITDNDKKQDTIDTINDLNTELEKGGHLIKLKCDLEVEKFTFEVCLYKENEKLLKNISQQKPGTEAAYNGVPIEKNIAYMLKNKTESAMHLANKYSKEIKAPKYIEEGIKWLIQN